MTIHIHGARQNNLQNVDVAIPRGKLTVVTGVSGSGKSSLAFDTLYAEGQRRYVESFSTYARQFLERMDRPDVDRIDGLLPAVALEQKNTIRSSRSTLGTLTELTDYLKVIYAKLADLYCPTCGELVRPDHPSEVAAELIATAAGRRLVLAFPFSAGKGEDAAMAARFMVQQGYRRVWRKGRVEELDEPGVAPLKGKELIIVDRLAISADEKARLIESIEAAYRLSDGFATLLLEDPSVRGGWATRNIHRDRQHCGQVFDLPSEGLFSFSSPLGACEPCKGFGRVLDIDMDRVVPDRRRTLSRGAIEPWTGEARGAERKALREVCKARGVDLDAPFERLPEDDQRFILEGGDFTTAGRAKTWRGVRGWFKMLEQKTYKMYVRVFLSHYRAYVNCTTCGGSRLKPQVRQWRVGDRTLPEVLAMTVAEARQFVATLPDSARSRAMAPVTSQLEARLTYLERVGLGYLTLDRQARTLSGGEVQRANLTTTLGSGLVNTLFVLDEPTVGLHAADSERLAEVLSDLVARDNTVVVVEHDPDMLRVADHLVEMGPGPGRDGGRVLFAGPPSDFHDVPESPTLRALARLAAKSSRGKVKLADATPRSLPSRLPQLGGPELAVRGARAHNLKGFDVAFPVRALSVITGVSGSGKSTLLDDVIYKNILRQLGRVTDPPGRCDAVAGLEHFKDVVWIDQSPPQASSRANPVTYVGAWDHFRQLFARTDLARQRGYTPTTFSFNAGDGRCPACEGSGLEIVEMQFLADVNLACEVCGGKRFKDEVLAVRWSGRSVAEVLDLTVDEAVPLLNPKLQATAALRSLQDVGLGYLKLGQPLSTLSGGEAQRIKLAEHLASRSADLLFLLDEPTTGLHLEDVQRLIAVLDRLVRVGHHTVICIEHHLDVIAAADHVVDIGPEGGAAGGQLLFAGPPHELVRQDTATGQHLARWLKDVEPIAQAAARAASRSSYTAEGHAEGWITVEGARTHNLKGIDVRIPRSGRTVVSGVSGSGKSTLVFDIIFAEGQRRFLDCLSSYARQFIMQLGKPDADRIEGIPPTVAIEQRTTRGGSRSNVANVTEIEPFLRILWARLGQVPGAGVSGGLTVDALLAHLKAEDSGPVHVCAPIVQARQGFHLDVLRRAEQEGLEVVVNGVRSAAEDVPRLRKKQHHDIDFVLGHASPRASEFRALLQDAATLGKSQVKIISAHGPRLFQVVGVGLDDAMARSESGFDPRYFSARTRLGRCERCEGWGVVDDAVCGECGGLKLGPIGRSVVFGGKTFPEVLQLTPPALIAFLEGLPLDRRGAAIAEGAIKAVRERVQFLEEVGLGYLALDRAVRTLSGGEAQRIRLAAQLGAHLSGVLYVLDEPTIGLHPTDTEKLLKTLDDLEARGNGILMVEHDETTLRTADVLIDIGPGAGVEGGQVLAQGPIDVALASEGSLTGRCLANPRPRVREAPRELPPQGKGAGPQDWIEVLGIQHHSLKGVDVKVPRGRLTVVTGVSGSGKSSLIEVLSKAIAPDKGAGEWRKIRGTEGLESLVEIDDKPIGKNPRSTPATYVGVWDDIRTMFAALPESKVRAYDRGRFSFNVAGGRCEACAGAGTVTLEMSFLPEAYVACGVCNGTRYAPQTLQVRWEGHSIHDVLNMPVREALKVFERVHKIKRQLELLDDVGLGYLTLGQGSPTLSGGEAQRIKLVTHLVGRGQPKTVLILDEPSIGLHMADIPRLLEVLHRLVDRGATVIVVEHNTDIMREADWIIDMGPGPGVAGGEVVYQGPYEGLVGLAGSRTGEFLAREAGLEPASASRRKVAKPAPARGEVAKPAPSRGEVAKPAPSRGEVAKPAPSRGEVAKPTPSRGEVAKPAPSPEPSPPVKASKAKGKGAASTATPARSGGAKRTTRIASP